MDRMGLFSTAYPFMILSAVFFFWICWSSAAIADDVWWFGNETASVLGKAGEDNSDILFNTGCKVSGVILAVSGLIRAYGSQGLERLVGVFFIPAGVFLSLVGFIPMDTVYDAHCFVAISFAIFMLCAVISGTVNEWKQDRPLSSSIGVVMLLCCIGVSLPGDLAFAENWCILLASLWMFADAFRVAYVYRNGYVASC